MADLVTRPVTIDDVDLITDHRVRMFADNGHPQAVLEAMTEPFRTWLTSRLRNGTYVGWVMDDEGAAAASCGLLFLDWPPHYLHPTVDCRPYVLNVFVDARHRGRGLQRKLMELCEAECRARGMNYVVLHASVMGRPLYERMNWVATNEMALTLQPEL